MLPSSPNQLLRRLFGPLTGLREAHGFRRWLGPAPGRREAHAIGWIALMTGIILCGISVLLGFHGRTFLGRPLGGDFVEFYTIGKILNNYAPARIYDLALATALQHAALPTMPATQMLVFGQAPFIASLFRPFALLPYAWAYVAWLGFSAALYSAGLAVLFRTLRWTAVDCKTGFLLALSATPFVYETWIGGQMSVVAFFIWALFFWFLENERPAVAGFVLAFCLYKPTLVALPALMLVLGRRWRAVAGFASGAAAVVGLTVATVGPDGCHAWLRALAMNGQTAAQSGEAWHLAKYIDLLAFSHLLFPGQPALAAVVFLGLGGATVGFLGLKWLKSDNIPLDRQLWAVTLCLTLVVNAYAPIYDGILAIFAVIFAVSARRESMPGWVALLYLVPWLTQSFAEFLHVQLLTLALAGFAFWLIETTKKSRSSPSKPKREESSMMLPV